MKLVIGNKNFSSWSLRPWLALKHCEVPFEEEVIALDQPDTAERIRKHSPSGRVPTLIDGDLTLWDSIAICEYLNEKFPQRQLWPADPKKRAVARSVSAEMHSGFAALRTHHPMKFKNDLPSSMLRDDVKADVARIDEIWTTCREKYGQGGPFLFGAFSIADAMYAPVVSRCRTYHLPLGKVAQVYADLIWNLPAMQQWLEASRAEKFQMSRYDDEKK